MEIRLIKKNVRPPSAKKEARDSSTAVRTVVQSWVDEYRANKPKR